MDCRSSSNGLHAEQRLQILSNCVANPHQESFDGVVKIVECARFTRLCRQLVKSFMPEQTCQHFSRLVRDQ